jgi:hypothetical protein
MFLQQFHSPNLIKIKQEYTNFRLTLLSNLERKIKVKLLTNSEEKAKIKAKF